MSLLLTLVYRYPCKMLNHLIDFSVLLYSQPEVSFQSVAQIVMHIKADSTDLFQFTFRGQMRKFEILSELLQSMCIKMGSPIDPRFTRVCKFLKSSMDTVLEGSTYPCEGYIDFAWVYGTRHLNISHGCTNRNWKQPRMADGYTTALICSLTVIHNW